MIIDSTYFEENNFIANVNEPDPNSKTATALDLAIDVITRDVLQFAFGRQMFDDFKQYYEAGFVGVIPTNYTDLVDGCEYEKNDKTYYWDGLRNEDTKQSLLADLVYYVYHTQNVTQTTELGEVAIEHKVGNRVSIAPKTTAAWNKFLRKFNGAVGSGVSGFTLEMHPYWIIPNRLGNGYGVSYYGYGDSQNVNLLQFLTDNVVNYPLWEGWTNRFGGELKNEYGI